MNKSKKSTVKTVIFMSIFAVIVIIAYLLISTRTTPLFTQSDRSNTELEKLLNKDIPNNYPSSPREVVKLYCKITKYLYNHELGEDRVEKLSDQALCLYDDELIANNAKEEYFLDLKVDISNYQDNQKVIMQYMVENSDLVVYWEKDNKEYASLTASFTTKEGDTYAKIFEDFILRKDSTGKWKIMGWKLSDKTEIVGGD